MTGVTRLVVALLGLVYLVLGVAGFFTPETADVGHHPQNAVWLFSASGLLNLLHTLLGVAGLAAALRTTTALAYSWAAFIALTGLTAYGLVAATGNPPEDPVNINWADNWLHGLSALILLATGVLATRALREARQSQSR